MFFLPGQSKKSYHCYHGYNGQMAVLPWYSLGYTCYHGNHTLVHYHGYPGFIMVTMILPWYDCGYHGRNMVTDYHGSNMIIMVSPHIRYNNGKSHGFTIQLLTLYITYGYTTVF